jgi:hypothetical protein
VDWETEFWAALGATGADYSQLVLRLIARGREVIPALEDRAQNGRSWQEQVLASILLERFEKGDAAQTVRQTRPDVEYSRSVDIRVERYGEMLAKLYANSPMALAELVWKSGETVDPVAQSTWGKLSSELPLYAISALGRLHERRAVPLLTDWVHLHQSIESVGSLDFVTATQALGQIGDSRAVPALLGPLVIYWGGRGGHVCGEALKRCIDQRGREVTNHFGIIIEHPEVSQFLFGLTGYRPDAHGEEK